jgi:hypothetical protein
MSFLLAVVLATVAWFIAAAILFFNPIVDKIYNKEEGHPAVRSLPKAPKTIGMILTAVVIQSALWAGVYTLVESALPGSTVVKGLVFGGVLTVTKIIPRDVDRLLLTTYPGVRMTIEFVIGIICALIVGLVFAFVL